MRERGGSLFCFELIVAFLKIGKMVQTEQVRHTLREIWNPIFRR